MVPTLELLKNAQDCSLVQLCDSPKHLSDVEHLICPTSGPVMVPGAFEQFLVRLTNMSNFEQFSAPPLVQLCHSPKHLSKVEYLNCPTSGPAMVPGTLEQFLVRLSNMSNFEQFFAHPFGLAMSKCMHLSRLGILFAPPVLYHSHKHLSKTEHVICPTSSLAMVPGAFEQFKVGLSYTSNFEQFVVLCDSPKHLSEVEYLICPTSGPALVPGTLEQFLVRLSNMSNFEQFSAPPVVQLCHSRKHWSKIEHLIFLSSSPAMVPGALSKFQGG
ncbi:hypothetical protein MPSEU_000407400 [Mayamaea pseudoterrestris]|nr:hypothetical protein MPSEU_000407400 [Mayamaea pseudoterrestris]